MKNSIFSVAIAVMLLLVVGFGLAAITTIDVGAAGEPACYGAQGGTMRVAGEGCTYVFESGSRVREEPHTLPITNGTVIAAAYGVQTLSMSVNSTATITTTGYVAGDVLGLYNPSPTYTLTIVDSGTAKLSSAIALAENDWAELWFDGTNWVQTGESNN
jgi:hypothetical protein